MNYIEQTLQVEYYFIVDSKQNFYSAEDNQNLNECIKLHDFLKEKYPHRFFTINAKLFD